MPSEQHIVGLHELCGISIERANEITNEIGEILSEICPSPDRIADLANKYGGEGVFVGMAAVLINNQVMKDHDSNVEQNPNLN